jgi:hypothetical protein
VFVTLDGDACIKSSALDSGAQGYVVKAKAAQLLRNFYLLLKLHCATEVALR